MAELLSLKDSKTEETNKRILLIGDPGTGKTKFLSTMPRPFINEFDPAGLETIIGMGVDGEAKEYSTSGESWKQFKMELDTWKKKGPQYDCKTFCVDSLTTASEAALDFVTTKNNNKRATLPDWGEAIQEVKDMLADLATLKCHTVVTSHLQVEKDEVLGGLEWLPLVYGRDLPSRIPIYFSEVYLTVAKTELINGVPKTKYMVQTGPDMRVKFIKSRMNKTGNLAHFEEPNFDLLLKKATTQTTEKS